MKEHFRPFPFFPVVTAVYFTAASECEWTFEENFSRDTTMGLFWASGVSNRHQVGGRRIGDTVSVCQWWGSEDRMASVERGYSEVRGLHIIKSEGDRSRQGSRFWLRGIPVDCGHPGR